MFDINDYHTQHNGIIPHEYHNSTITGARDELFKKLWRQIIVGINYTCQITITLTTASFKANPLKRRKQQEYGSTKGPVDVQFSLRQRAACWHYYYIAVAIKPQEDVYVRRWPRETEREVGRTGRVQGPNRVQLQKLTTSLSKHNRRTNAQPGLPSSV